MKRRHPAKTVPPAAAAPTAPARRSWSPFQSIPVALAVLVGILVLLFIRSFAPGVSLATGDAPLQSLLSGHYRYLDGGYIARWSPGSGLGAPMTALYLAPGYLLAHIVPYTKYADANYLFHLAVMGVLAYFLVLDLTRHRPAAFLGAAWLMLQPHVFSHILPGHIGHLQMAAWIPGVVLFLRKAVRTNHPAFWGLTGLCMGLVINSGTLDVALFIAIAVAAYGLFLVWRERRQLLGGAEASASHRMGAAAKLLLGGCLAGGITLAAGYQAIVDNIAMHLGGPAAVETPAAPADNQAEQQKWFWATQWSVPPEELLDTAVPGFFGWGSSNPQNPYRGRVGQTEGFFQHRQGLPNLNDVSIYLGSVILLACLAALYLRRRDPEVWFLLALAVVSCLLSFGKHAPLYRFFYELPYMDTMRNPIKWFYVTSLYAGMLGGIGFAAVLSPQPPASSRRFTAAAVFLAPAAVVLASGAFFLATCPTGPAGLFWQNPLFRELSGRSLVAAALLWAAAGTVFLLLVRRSSRPEQPGAHTAGAPSGLTWALAAILIGEMLFVDAHYMRYAPVGEPPEGGALADLINAEKMPFRIKVLGRDGVFAFINGPLAMANGWEDADDASGRTLDESSLFFRALAGNPYRMLQLCNVRFVISPPGALPDYLKPALSVQAGSQKVQVSRFTGELPRYFLVPEWQSVPPSNRFDSLTASGFDPARTVLIHAPENALPTRPTPPAQKLGCRITDYRWNRVRVETDTDQEAMLVGSDRYSPMWRAYLDGAESPMWQADGMLRAVAVPAGRHTVELRLVGKGALPLWIVLGAWALGLAMAAWAFVRFRRRSTSSAAGPAASPPCAVPSAPSERLPKGE